MGVGDQLLIDVRREPDRVVIRLGGELDLANAPLLQGAIEDADVHGRSMLVLDLQDLVFIDSTGLRIILWARERCEDGDREFAITPGSQQVQRLLAVSGAGEHLRIIPQADDLLV
ncbi:MAG: rsbV [Solirubrobacterales bacterium]|jgi:anti-anti-sigma factor|nr:rsbV [Solirubrobacterales bacterium]